MIENDKHYHNATHDTMTEAYNRSFLLETLSNYIYKAKRYNLQFSVIRFNIDNITSINETHGFIEGDKKINHIISIIFKNIRTSDIIARYDSDDFILLLPQTSAIKCELICENLKNVINNDNDNENLTVSFGITDFHIADNTSTITNRAKDALLKAKENGKNCFVRL
jgi:diguanylate cyclase (GGDEF)-like protein